MQEDKLFETGLTIILGALVVSQVLVLSLLLNFYSSTLILVVKSIGVAITLAGAAYQHLNSSEFSATKWTFIAISAPMLLFLLLTFSLDSPVPHPDAQQYHLALPWVYATEQSLISERSLMQLGLYMGYDLLYLMVGDIRTLSDDPGLMSALYIFNAASMMLLLSATYTLSRAFGATRSWSVLATASVLTMGAVMTYWGDLKNDYMAAGLGLCALVLLHRAWTAASTEGLILATLVAAFSVTVKISTLIPVGLPFLFAYASGRFRWQTVFISIGVGSGLMAPWLWYAFVLQGTPIYPLGVKMPDVIALGWDARNANGLPGGVASAIKNFFELLLGRYHIPGNQSLGLPFLAATVGATAGILTAAIKKRFGLTEAIVTCAIVWLIIFYIDRFDGRFLSRYIVLCGCVFFAYCAFILSNVSERLSRQSRFSPAVMLTLPAMLLLVDLSGAKWLASVSDNGPLGQGLSKWHTEWTQEYEDWTEFHKTVNDMAQGSGVAVNDHFILFLEGPYMNLHGLHARELNLYERDAGYIHALLQRKGIELFIYRPNISGTTDALTQFIENCTQRLVLPKTIREARQVYKVSPDCKTPLRPQILRGSVL